MIYPRNLVLRAGDLADLLADLSDYESAGAMLRARRLMAGGADFDMVRALLLHAYLDALKVDTRALVQQYVGLFDTILEGRDDASGKRRGAAPDASRVAARARRDGAAGED